MDNRFKEAYVPEDCTHDCYTCGASCDSRKRGPSFFDKMEHISAVLEDVGEDNIIRMLNEAVDEWEAEDAADEEAGKTRTAD